MLNISLSVLRLFGEPRLILEKRPGIAGALILQDTDDELQAAKEVSFYLVNADPERVARAVEAFNREIANANQ